MQVRLPASSSYLTSLQITKITENLRARCRHPGPVQHGTHARLAHAVHGRRVIGTAHAWRTTTDTTLRRRRVPPASGLKRSQATAQIRHAPVSFTTV